LYLTNEDLKEEIKNVFDVFEMVNG